MTDEQLAALLTAQNAALERIATALEDMVGTSNNQTGRLERIAVATEKRTPSTDEPPPALAQIAVGPGVAENR